MKKMAVRSSETLSYNITTLSFDLEDHDMNIHRRQSHKSRNFNIWNPFWDRNTGLSVLSFQNSDNIWT